MTDLDSWTPTWSEAWEIELTAWSCVRISLAARLAAAAAASA